MGRVAGELVVLPFLYFHNVSFMPGSAKLSCFHIDALITGQIFMEEETDGI